MNTWTPSYRLSRRATGPVEDPGQHDPHAEPRSVTYWYRPVSVDVRQGDVWVSRERAWTMTGRCGPGHLVMRCGCGDHQETMHKTPSNPAHFRQRAARMVRTCCRDSAGLV